MSRSQGRGRGGGVGHCPSKPLPRYPWRRATLTFLSLFCTPCPCSASALSSTQQPSSCLIGKSCPARTREVRFSSFSESSFLKRSGLPIWVLSRLFKVWRLVGMVRIGPMATSQSSCAMPLEREPTRCAACRCVVWPSFGGLLKRPSIRQRWNHKHTKSRQACVGDLCPTKRRAGSYPYRGGNLPVVATNMRRGSRDGASPR